MKRRAFNWIGVCTALAFAAFVASCDDSPMGTPEQTTTAGPEEAAEAPAPSMDFVPLGVDVWGDCLNEDPDDGPDGTRFNNATCTANDVEIKVLQALAVDYDGEGVGDPPVPIPPGGSVTCVEGTTFDVQLRAYFGFNRQTTYDIGYYLAEDGGDAKIGDCFHGFLSPIADGGAGSPTAGPPYNGPYRDAEQGTDPTDVCGDGSENDETTVNGIAGIGAVKDVPEWITVTCEDNDDDGQVEIGTCTSWDINASDGSTNKPTCEGVEDAYPGTTAKCNCEPAALPINVMRQATVEVKKALSPTDDAGTFDLAVYDYNDSEVDGADGVTHNGTTGQYTFMWDSDDEPEQNQASVEENGANLGPLDETTTPSAFAFYTTTYSCVENNNGNGPVNGSGTGPVDLTLANDDEWVCTFTNTRIPPPTVTVTKDATESFDRAWGWTLTKDVYLNGATPPAETCSTLGSDIDGVQQVLQLGQDLTVCYVVDATRTGPTDSNHNVSGTINVSVAASTAPYSANFTVTDVIKAGDLAATVDCDGTAGAPFVNTKSGVAQGGSFSCTYSRDLTPAQAAAVTRDTATAAASWNTGDSTEGGGAAASTFTGVTPSTETDATADVDDTWYDQPEFSLADDLAGSQTFTFNRDLSCPDYGDYTIENDADLLSSDGNYDLTDDADVPISCPRPPSGCTLTQGFWRTHSEYGPAPYADGWEEVTGSSACSEPGGSPNSSGEGADVEFGLDETGAATIDSDLCYYEVMWDPGQGGNMWFKLAHQYIAAWLNINAGGSDPTPVADALADAADLLAYYDQQGPGTTNQNKIPKQGTDWCDTQPGGSDCKSYNSDRQYAVYLNNLLTDYNEGLIGPGHCDDDAQSLFGSNVE